MASRVTVLLACAVLAGCSSGERTDPSARTAPAAGTPDLASAEPDAEAEARLTARIGPPDYAECLRSGAVRTVDAESSRVGGGAAPLRRLVVAVDASGSMAGRLGGETKMAVARDAATRFLTAVPGDVEVGLVAFGHKGSNRESDRAVSCAGVEALYPVSRAARADVAAAVLRMTPVGWTPLAGGLARAQSMLARGGRAGEQVVYVVSDGVETCGGDPVAAARALHAGDTRAIVNVIGFDLPAEDERQLRAVAEAGGGSFRNFRGAGAAAEVRSEAQRASREVRARGRAAAAQVGNAAQAAGANVASAACVARRTVREQLAVSSMLRDRTIDPELAARIRAALARRHRAAEAALAAGAEANDARRDRANARVDTATARTLGAPP